MSFQTNACRAVAIIFCAHASLAGGWEPAKGPLATRWSRDVSPENALPEYPRPQMVRENWVNLNGLWDYAIRPAADERPSAWDGQILVPFPIESALSGVMKAVGPDQKLWYRCKFELPKLSYRQPLLLQFGAVDWKCTVWVNGRKAGEHTGGYDPFTFDITGAIKRGENELIVAVTDPTDTGSQPHGKQVLKPKGIMYTAVTGIWQTVWLEPVASLHVESLKIVPDVDRSVVRVSVASSATDSLVRVQVIKDDKPISKVEGRARKELEVPVPNAELWSPNHPNLYELRVELLAGERVVDTVESYFGMRKIEVKKDADGVNRLWLNNEVLFQYGPLDQGWWPDGLYTAATDDALKYDIEMTKKLGMNMARKHVKVEPARWYYWCDKLGLLVWQDMPSGDADHGDEADANYRGELQAMIDALWNHPSIVMWVPFNEGWGQHDTRAVAKWVQEYDPSRPVNEASGWNDKGSGNVSDMHSYPGPGMREPESDRVVVLGEFGGLGMPVTGHTWQQEKNWGYVSYKDAEELTDAYVGSLTAMRPLVGRGLSAAVYTQTSDVEVEVNGLMTYDREQVKMDESRIAAAARKLYGPPPVVKTVVPTSEKEPQTWRYTTTKPADDWMAAEFDDSAWETGPGGFGTEGTPGAIARTEWRTPDIWLRRTFELDSLPQGSELMLNIHHDEGAEVYLNGTLAQKLKRFVSGYGPAPLSADARKALQTGRNTIAVHCHQTSGGQYIDVGLMEISEP